MSSLGSARLGMTEHEQQQPQLQHEQGAPLLVLRSWDEMYEQLVELFLRRQYDDGEGAAVDLWSVVDLPTDSSSGSTSATGAAAVVVDPSSSSVLQELQSTQTQKMFHFDSDSFLIGVDNHASRSISNNIRHFVTPFTRIPKTRCRIRGIGNQMLPVAGEGTVLWKWEDDDGNVHQHYIDGVLYVPAAPFCLLSPQHWSQQAKDNKPKEHGTWCATYDDTCVLHWKQQQFKRTIQLDTNTNTARFRSASGATRYRVFAATQDAQSNIEANEHVIYQAQVDLDAPHIIPDDNTELSQSDSSTIAAQDQDIGPTSGMREENLSDFFQASETSSPVPHIITDDDEDTLTAISPQADLRRWHYRLGHASFHRLRLLAMLGILPRRLASVQPPKCAGCMFGALTKRPWRTKTAKNS